MHRKLIVLALIGILTPLAAAAEDAPTTAAAADFSHTWLLHLPGIGGEMSIDRALVRGLKDGGWEGPIDVYDWTENDPGIDALHARKRNDREAQKVADMIEEKLKDDPKLQITLTSHSGGTGIAVWALEKLPERFHLRTLVLLASALSPDYDLTAALKHVTGQAYVYYSENDTLVLGAGTELFGTIDGKKTVAAGLVGFKTPPDVDKKQYDKLVQRPWVKEWMVFENAGSHIGCMSRPFVRQVLAPTLIDSLGGTHRILATTQPADAVNGELAHQQYRLPRSREDTK
jgi:hypothetical protein